MTHSTEARKGALLLLISSILWGTTGTAQTFLPASASSLTVGAVRLSLASLALVTIVLLQGGFKFTPAWSWKTAIMGGAGIAVSQLSFLSGVRMTGVAVGTIVTMGSAPIFAAVLDAILQKEQFSRNWYLATLVSVAGILALALGSSSRIDVNPLGILLTLLAGLSAAVMMMANKRLLKGHPIPTVLAVNTTIGAILVSPLFFAGDFSWLATPRGIAVALHLGLVTNVAAQFIFAGGLRIVSVHSAATLSLGEPLTATLLGILVVGEQFTVYTIIGMVLIFVGLLILTLYSPKQ